MPNYILQTNNIVEVTIVAALSASLSDLIYTGGGGLFFNNILKEDSIAGGKQHHGGNPKISPNESPIYKKCNKINLTKEKLSVISGEITRGLLIQKYKVDPNTITDGYNLKSNSIYYWDEVYTAPLGYFTKTSGVPASFEFNFSGNNLILKTNDVNIIPKIGDYIIFQKLPNGYVKPSDINISPISSPIEFSGIFSDGVSNMPFIIDTETYQVKITSVAFTQPTGILTTYNIITDKSLNEITGKEYSIVLLNRENTGLQKELFYDTFEQIEINRQQLLGDPYLNLSTVKPKGRKNQLYYNNSQFLGIKNLLSGIINKNDNELLDTPFIVYNLDEDIKDRFYPLAGSSVNKKNSFEFHIPNVMIQGSDADKLNVLVNYGQILNDETSVGLYSGLYLKSSGNTNQRLGWLFYDLKIIVVDDPELAIALGYNSNRNYTLPRPTLISPGNNITNITSTISLDVVGLESTGFSPMAITVNGAHNLTNGTAIIIKDIKTKSLGSNLIHSSNANGLRYIKKYYNGTVEKTDKFYIYTEPGLTISLPPDGEFVNSGIGQSGKIEGAKLKYNYFVTYRIKNKRYDSILPYGELISFNFAKSEIDSQIDNIAGYLYLKLPPFTYLDNGYEIDDLEFIVGEWVAGNVNNPLEITGFKNVIVISSQDIVSPGSPSNLAPDSNYIISILNYQTQVTKINNGISPYTLSNIEGDPRYDILNNFKHYNITTGTLPETLLTSNGKWTLGNISYKTQANQYRSKIQININAEEWNDTTNPTYDPDNTFINEKYISEIAICDPNSDKPIIYAKIAPPIKKSNNLDIILNLSIDF